MMELVLGGARSGKSVYAEQRARESGLECIYIATAQAGDAEMAARIQHHRERRRGFAATIEEPVQLAATIAAHASAERFLLVDCLTLWLTNLLLGNDESYFARERAVLFDALDDVPGHILLVSNEVGLGIVPADPLSRRFVDEAGRLHQQLAAISDRMVFMIAGLPQILKDTN